MTKHTPGPWLAKRGRKTTDLVITAAGKIIAFLWAKEDTANAALIAAAPDGLEAAIDMVAAWDNPTSRVSRARAIDKLRAFITKAEGNPK